jgi:hypothetical protein
MKINWRLFTNCTSQKTSRVVAARILNKSGATKPVIDSILPYEKGGFVVDVSTELTKESWSELVYEALVISQRVGYGWCISGSIADALDLWSNESNVPGIISMHLRMESFESNDQKQEVMKPNPSSQRTAFGDR